MKLKASQIGNENIKTGGGESKVMGLTNIEERLMNVYWWKSITDDGNVEFGLVL